jgi:hypothetical protein
MRSLWFKQRYVAPILAGEKRDTVRLRTRLAAGDVIGLSVGPRTPFATAEILSVERVTLADLMPERAAEVAALVGEAEYFVRIRFRVLAH